MSKHPVFGTILKQISDHRYSDEPFAALADFKQIIENARNRTRHELLRNTPGAKLLIADTAMRAFWNRHFGHTDALLRSMGASGQCFDRYSFECTKLSLVEPDYCQLHTGEHFLNGRRRCIIYLGLRPNKDNVLAKCRLSLRAWVSENQSSAFMQLPTKMDARSVTKTSQARGYVHIGAGSLSHAHHAHKNILEFVHKAPEDIQWTIDKQEFDVKWIATRICPWP